MRISTAYFAGVGTVIVAVAAGLGGGYLAANIANPPSRGVQAGTQDVGGADIRRGGTGATGAACGCDEPCFRAGTGATAATAANGGSSAVRQCGSAHQQCPRRREARRTMSRPCSPSRHSRNLQNQPNRNQPNRPEKKPLRLGTPSREPATPTSNARTRKSGAPNGASSGPKGAASSSRVSRNSRRLKRGSGK